MKKDSLLLDLAMAVIPCIVGLMALVALEAKCSKVKQLQKEIDRRDSAICVLNMQLDEREATISELHNELEPYLEIYGMQP